MPPSSETTEQIPAGTVVTLSIEPAAACKPHVGFGKVGEEHKKTTDDSSVNKMTAGQVDNEHRPSRHAFEELCLLLPLSLGLCITWISFTMKETVDMAVVGHLGKVYAEAVALSYLWMSATYGLMSSNALSVFVSQAIGARNPAMCGVYLQVALVVQGTLAVFVGISWLCTGPLLSALGYAPEVVSAATYYTMITTLRLPLRTGDQLVSFYGGMKKVTPGVVAALTGISLNLVLQALLVIVLGLGFRAVPLITNFAECVELAILIGVYWLWLKLHAPYWPDSGWSWASITWRRVTRFAKLSTVVGLSSTSDSWRQATLGLVVSRIGPKALLVYALGYRLSYIFAILVSGMAHAMVVRAGNALGANGVPAAKRTFAVATAAVAVLAGLSSMALILVPLPLASLFSTDPGYLQEFLECRVAMAAFNFLYHLGHILQYIPIAVGRSEVTFWLGVVGSWAVQVPLVLALTQLWRSSMTAVFTGVALGYVVLCGGLVVFIASLDWERCVADAQKRSEVEVSGATAEL